MRFPRNISSFITLFSLLFPANYPGAVLFAAPAPLTITQDAFALPEGRVGVSYEYQFQSEGGLAPLTWRVSQGELPPGLKLENTGKLVGAPTQARRDGYVFVIEVSDSSRSPQKFEQPFQLLIHAAPLRIVTAPQKLRIVTANSPDASHNRASPSPQPGTNGARESEVANLRVSIDDSASNPESGSTAARQSHDPTSSLLAPPAAATVVSAASAGATTNFPPATQSAGTARLCGKLRPASLDNILARLGSLQRFNNTSTNRGAELLKSIKDGSKFNSGSCDDNSERLEMGEQKNAVVELLTWILQDDNWTGVVTDIRSQSGNEPMLTKQMVRRQILQLNQYLGNVTMQLKIGDNIVTTVTDRDGNYDFASVPTPDQTGLHKVSLSSEANDNYTMREYYLKHGDTVRLDLSIEDRPVSLLARAVIGYQQAGSAASESEQNYFFDLFVSKSLPFAQKFSPDFGEAWRLWGAIRAISVPQTGQVKIGEFPTSFFTNVANLQAREAARVFDYMGGIELRLTGNNALLPSFDRETKQKFSLSFIAGFGFVTPTNPLENEPTVYDLTARLKDSLIEQGILTRENQDKFRYVAFVPNGRDRFFRQYYAGIRMQTFFFNQHNVPMQRFPAQFDLTVGQNEYVTGGRMRGPVMRFDGYFPLPYEKLKFINLFGTAVIKPVRVRENQTLPLRVATSPDSNNPIKASDDSVLLVPVSQFNRDYYRAGVGVDFISFINFLLRRN